jgi:hypothetical protein
MRDYFIVQATFQIPSSLTRRMFINMPAFSFAAPQESEARQRLSRQVH